MNVLGIFVKRPVAGQVKTRLASRLGDERAAQLYAAFIADLVDRFREVAVQRYLCYAPDDDDARREFEDRGAGDYQLWPQPADSLGQRMDAFFREAFRTGADRVVLIGSDSPNLPAHLIDEAFARLETNDCVLGPATDGGFYLIGQSGQCRPLFDGVTWSNSRVLAETVRNAAACQARTAVLTPWYDVDTLDDLEMLRGHVLAQRLGGESTGLKETEPLLVWDTV